MEMPCYCCYSGSNKRMSSKTDADMDQLNAALDELGMLSSVTESRKQYLREKSVSRGKKAAQRPGYRIISQNRDYVSQYLGYWDLNSPGMTKSEDYETMFTYKYGEEAVEAQSKMRLGRRRMFQKPYEVPWRFNFEDRCRGTVNCPDSDSSRDSGLGNRSNPGSPERTQRDNPGSVSLSRSRSLDGLVIGVDSGSSELENMSQKMEDLHILEKGLKRD